MKNTKVMRGTVVEALPATKFRVEFPGGKIVIAHLAGKMRLNHIRTVPGDQVEVVMSDDGTIGRITRRL